MKILKKISIIKIAVLFASFSFMFSCNSDSNDEVDELDAIELNQDNEEALLFMLEEEKLARDTYDYLNELWSLNQFANIKKSEQKHMDAVANLLTQGQVPYSILAAGEFANLELQTLYNELIENGAVSKENALQIGATIEDLDIHDLQTFMDVTMNEAILTVFESLQCGSRNHLRSFISSIESAGDTYEPQFITSEEFISIVNSDNEQCN